MRHAKYRRSGRTRIALGTALLLAGLTACGQEDAQSARRAQYAAAWNEQLSAEPGSVLLADLTGDGLEEMLVVRLYDQEGAALDPEAEELDRFSYGGVAVYGVTDGQVTHWDGANVGAAHVGWGHQYLCPKAEGGPALLTFSPYRNQGLASYSYTLFRYDEDGNQQILDCDSVHFVFSAAPSLAGDLEQSSRAEVEDFLARVEEYRADALPLLVYDTVDHTTEFRYWAGNALEGDDTAGRAVGAARDLAYPLPLEED